ncbi:MAG: hypothetical protein U1G07_05575 [Verrucomicrobiota bacterium]
MPDQERLEPVAAFQSAWLVMLARLVYRSGGWQSGHFREKPGANGSQIVAVIFRPGGVDHLRLNGREVMKAYNAAADYLFVRYLRRVPGDDLDRAGDVTGGYFLPGRCSHRGRWSPIRANDSFPGHHFPDGLCRRAPVDDLPVWILEAHAGDDHGWLQGGFMNRPQTVVAG